MKLICNIWIFNHINRTSCFIQLMPFYFIIRSISHEHSFQHFFVIQLQRNTFSSLFLFKLLCLLITTHLIYIVVFFVIKSNMLKSEISVFLEFHSFPHSHTQTLSESPTTRIIAVFHCYIFTVVIPIKLVFWSELSNIYM